MAIYLSDDFTDTDSTLVTDHTPTTAGSTWLKRSGDANVFIFSNKACHTNASPNSAYMANDAAATSGREEVTCTWIKVGTPAQCAAVVRASSNVQNFYMALWIVGSNQIRLYSMKSNSSAALATAVSYTPTGTHTMKLTCETVGSGVEIKCYMDGAGTPTTEYTDTASDRITTAGRAGFFVGNTTASNGMHLDSIVAEDIQPLTTSLILPRAGRAFSSIITR